MEAKRGAELFLEGKGILLEKFLLRPNGKSCSPLQHKCLKRLANKSKIQLKACRIYLHYLLEETKEKAKRTQTEDEYSKTVITLHKRMWLFEKLVDKVKK